MAVWTAEANWPEAWTSIYFSPITIESGEFIVYVSGGFPIRKFYKYNISTNAWTELAVPPNYVNAPISMSPDGSRLATHYAYNILFIFDIAGNSWSSSPAAPQISGIDAGLLSVVWADNDTIWATVRAFVSGAWRIKCFKYVVSTTTWTQYTNYLLPAAPNPYATGISPDGTTLYFGNCGSSYYKASKYVIATDTYSQDVINIFSAYYFTICSDRNRLWYGPSVGGLAQITRYRDLSDLSEHTVFPSNASRTKPTNITAGIGGGASAIVHYGLNEPKNWSYVQSLAVVTTDPATAIR